jgi:hypothetical protein
MRRGKRWTRRSPLIPFAAVLLAYAAFFGARSWYRNSVRLVTLAPTKDAYLHYELVELSLSSNDPELKKRWRARAPVAVVRRDGRDVTTVAGVTTFPLKEDLGAWRAKWAVPWNASTGTYNIALVGQDDLGDRLSARSFRIIRRKPLALPKGLSVLTLESDRPLAEMRIKAPDGTMTDWRGLLDWAQYIGADAFWMLGGQTPGPGDGQVWVSVNFDMIPKVAAEAKRRGLKFGVYAECYLTMTKDGRQVGGYEYARDAAEGRTFVTRSISLRDEKRPRDVAALLKRFRDTPGVDFVGLDYIRNALGGYELADQFFAEMPGVHPPPEWPRLSEEERMVWFARKKIMRRDDAFIDAWQWWRAHKVGTIVRRIKDELGGKTPLWAFTLTWDKGWNHGQDPVMMNDAGVDADALMMYEADKDQYAAIIHDFHAYVHRADVQLVVGDIMDWPLHQKDPAGPKELYRRSVQAIDHIYADGPAYGVFFHDAARALGGRLGPWGTRGWLDEARRAVKHVKEVQP